MTKTPKTPDRTEWRNWGDSPIVVVVSIIASLISIIAFLGSFRFLDLFASIPREILIGLTIAVSLAISIAVVVYLLRKVTRAREQRRLSQSKKILEKEAVFFQDLETHFSKIVPQSLNKENTNDHQTK